MDEHWQDDELRSTFARLGFITCSGGMTALLRRAKKAADISDVTILLDGETGTGKQILAHAIHQLDSNNGRLYDPGWHVATVRRFAQV